MIDVVVILIEGGLPTTAVAPIEILSSAGYLWDILNGSHGNRQFRIRTASLGDENTSTIVPLTLKSEHSLEEIHSADLVVVSAGSGDLELECKRNAKLPPLLNQAYHNDTAIAGICTGVPLLAEAGILDGRPATTHWAVMDACRKRFPKVNWQPERYVTESDDIFCSGGVYSAVDLSLYLVEKYCGHKIAMQTAKALLLQTPRTWQAGYTAELPKSNHEDEQIQEAQQWLHKHFTNTVQIKDLAKQIGMSPRNFTRRFKAATGEAPIKYLQQLRVNAARHLLENDLKTIREVSRAVGYKEPGFFSKLFKRHTGMPPRTYRERFSTSPPESIAIGERTPHR